jgi:hypothetical protein
MTINWIQLFFESIILAIGLFILYWKSYLTESAKNKAIKKDIEEITEKIETIKNEINISTQRKLDYLIEKNKSAINFLDAISVWADFHLRPIDLIANNPANSRLLNQLISDLKKHGAETTSAYWKLHIYYSDKTFLDVCDKFYESCRTMHSLTIIMLIQLEKTAMRLDFYYEALNKTLDTKVILKNIKTEKDKITPLIDKYINERAELDIKINDIRLEFLVLLSIRLKKKSAKLGNV